MIMDARSMINWREQKFVHAVCSCSSDLDTTCQRFCDGLRSIDASGSPAVARDLRIGAGLCSEGV